MKKIMITLGFAALALGANAQVKIKDGTVTGSSVTPNSTAILDLESGNKGLHLPRVLLQATNVAAPLNGETTSFSTKDSGLVVYNLATAGTAPNNVTPGLYYCDGTKWVRLAQGSPSGNADWQVFSTTTPAANADNQFVQGSVAIGTNSAATVASSSSGSTAAQQKAMLTVANGDASINGITVGEGGAQDGASVAVGQGALQNNQSGGNNVAMGYQAEYLSTKGGSNTFIGMQAGYNLSTGNNNIGLGRGAGYSLSTGSNNILIGMQAGSGATITGNNNIGIGYQSLYGNTSGANNTALGYNAGSNISTGSSNIAIGSGQNVPTAGNSNQLNIGGAIFGTGLTGTATAPAGNIGIGTNAPGARLEVNNGGASTPNGIIKIVDGNQGANKVLTSDANGLGTWQTPAGAGWTLTGNAGTTASTSAIGSNVNNNFLGTTDANDLVLATNSKEGLRINNTSQQVLVGTTSVPTGGTAAKMIINSTTNGALQIVDGTQGAGKVLSSDANGVGTWSIPGVYQISGTLGSGINVTLGSIGGQISTGTAGYTNSYIDLPPGKWKVSVSMLLAYVPPSSLSTGGYVWVHTGFSTSSTANPGAIGGRYISTAFTARPYSSFTAVGSDQLYGMLLGDVIITNSSSATTRYYYWVVSYDSDTALTGAYFQTFGNGSWGEDTITALQLLN